MTRLALIPLALCAVSCSSSPPTVTPAPTSESAGPATPDPSAVTLTMELTNSQLAVGQERVSFRLFEPSGAEIVDGSYEVEVNVYRLNPQTGGASPVAGGSALYFGLPMEDGGAWVVYSDFDASGPWSFEALVRRGDGWAGRGWADLEVLGPTVMPRVGDRPSEVDTPTAAGADLSSVSSDRDPDPELYTLTLGEAIALGKPTIVYFGSPEHCATEVCRATLDEIKAVRAMYGSQASFIHVETHDLAQPDRMARMYDAWELPSEPWTFVLDERGRVSARIEGPLDRTELELLVKRALGLPQ